MKDQIAVFRSGDREQYSAAKQNLKEGIKCANATYKKNIEDHFTNRDPRLLLQGIHHITNYRSNKDPLVGYNSSLARFETEGLDNVLKPPPATI